MVGRWPSDSRVIWLSRQGRQAALHSRPLGTVTQASGGVFVGQQGDKEGGPHQQDQQANEGREADGHQLALPLGVSAGIFVSFAGHGNHIHSQQCSVFEMPGFHASHCTQGMSAAIATQEPL